MMQPDHCTDEVCRACDLKAKFYIPSLSITLQQDQWYWFLVEIDRDGRIPHEQNFEICPGYYRRTEDGAQTFTILRFGGKSALVYQSWSVMVLGRMDHPAWGSGFGPNGKLP